MIQLKDMPMNYIGRRVKLVMQRDVTVQGQLQQAQAGTVEERSLCSTENWVQPTGRFTITISGWTSDQVPGSAWVEVQP